MGTQREPLVEAYSIKPTTELRNRKIAGLIDSLLHKVEKDGGECFVGVALMTETNFKGFGNCAPATSTALTDLFVRKITVDAYRGLAEAEKREETEG